jgi:alkylation response protein AidB-like acyl-CoA dehydrogenase
MWDLTPSEDERMIADSVREFLARELPIERLRPKAPAVDAARVGQEIADLGWLGVGVAEDAGGSGLGLVEEMLIQRECGRYLVSPSVLATTLAAHLAVEAGDLGLAQAFVGGEPAAVAILDRASGRAQVFDWRDGRPLVAWSDDGLGLFEAAAFAGAPADCLDDSLSLHVGRLDPAQTKVWAPAGALTQRADVMVAAALVGLAEHACDLAVEYAKVRHQFGKPIGSFQAVKHRCADMGVRWRLAWCQTNLAALKVQADAPDAPLQAASAKLVAAHAAQENARAAIQVHGGIGFQSECDVHWFMKRTHVLDRPGRPGRRPGPARRRRALPAGSAARLGAGLALAATAG